MWKCQTVTVTNGNVNYSSSSQLFNELGSESSRLRRATAKAGPAAPRVNLEQSNHRTAAGHTCATAEQTSSQQTTCTMTAITLPAQLRSAQDFPDWTHISYSVHSFPTTEGPQSTAPGMLLQENKPLEWMSTFLTPSLKTHCLWVTELRVGRPAGLQVWKCLWDDMYPPCQERHLNTYLQALLRFFRLKIKLGVNTYILICTYI